ncbi:MULTISPECIES: ABC transporter ATP-binding protein [unclassified Mesorhizobium]|uniref:ABC transporter ATP-binding protein n=1 Tax=unclassified Mesorhizobium TaxID=325217 RepID=UPI00167384D1|nr:MULTISPECIES: ABC transporter ATP-binding protein [unclassified Mesorhizobium]
MATSLANGASVSLKGVTKRYGNFQAVHPVELTVNEGEFISLLGSSGSGKSTILMMIAGFEAPTTGSIYLDNQEIVGLPPYRRNIGVVFQRYALFPHLSVAGNIAYPLRRRSMPWRQVEMEVERALRLVNLEGLGDRLPSQLSGGQQQRVALARALVFRPRLLLLDEPLGALDRKLRQQLQIELKILHKEIGTTIILVTHDQEEALSMADRVAVMSKGQIEQIGKPSELFNAPANAFVADFVGETNLIPVDVVERSDDLVKVALEKTDKVVLVAASQCLTSRGSALLGIRPEHVKIVANEGMPLKIVERVFNGLTTSLLLALGNSKILVRAPTDMIGGIGGDILRVEFPISACRLYDKL